MEGNKRSETLFESDTATHMSSISALSKERDTREMAAIAYLSV